MTLRYSFLQACLAFARPLRMQYQKLFLYTALGTIAAILATHLAVRFPSSPVNFLYWGERVDGAGLVPIALIVYFGCETLATKLGSTIEKVGDSTVPRFSNLLACTLPVTTKNLVLAPMAVGVIGAASIWILFWLFAILPLGSPVPFLLPILLLTLKVTASKATPWTIQSKAGIGCLFMLMSTGAPYISLIAIFNHVPMVIVNLAVTSMILLSVKMALDSAPVVRNSMSNGAASRKSGNLARTQALTIEKKLPKMPSPLAAQTWFHLQSKGNTVTVYFVGLAAAILLLRIPFIGPENSVFTYHIDPIQYRITTSAVYQFWLLVPISLLICASFSTASALSGWLPTKLSSKYPPVPAFIAVRPISSADIVQAQLAAVSRAALGSSCVVWIASLIWTFSAVHVHGKVVTVAEELISEFSLKHALLLILFAALLPILIFSFQCYSMAVSRLPKSFREVAQAVSPFVALTGAILCGFPVVFPNSPQNLAIILSVAAVLVCTKLLFIRVAQVKLVKKRLISRDVFSRGAGSWLLLVLAISAALCALLPESRLPKVDILLLVALVIPANRILWQIYFLDASRHVGATKK